MPYGAVIAVTVSCKHALVCYARTAHAHMHTLCCCSLFVCPQVHEVVEGPHSVVEGPHSYEVTLSVPGDVESPCSGQFISSHLYLKCMTA